MTRSSFCRTGPNRPVARGPSPAPPSALILALCHVGLKIPCSVPQLREGHPRGKQRCRGRWQAPDRWLLQTGFQWPSRPKPLAGLSLPTARPTVGPTVPAGPPGPSLLIPCSPIPPFSSLPSSKHHTQASGTCCWPPAFLPCFHLGDVPQNTQPAGGGDSPGGPLGMHLKALAWLGPRGRQTSGWQEGVPGMKAAGSAEAAGQGQDPPARLFGLGRGGGSGSQARRETSGMWRHSADTHIFLQPAPCSGDSRAGPADQAGGHCRPGQPWAGRVRSPAKGAVASHPSWGRFRCSSDV